TIPYSSDLPDCEGFIPLELFANRGDYPGVPVVFVAFATAGGCHYRYQTVPVRTTCWDGLQPYRVGDDGPGSQLSMDIGCGRIRGCGVVRIPSGGIAYGLCGVRGSKGFCTVAIPGWWKCGQRHRPAAGRHAHRTVRTVPRHLVLYSGTHGYYHPLPHRQMVQTEIYPELHPSEKQSERGRSADLAA